MRKFFALFTCGLMLWSLVSGCTKQPATDIPTPPDVQKPVTPAPPQVEAEKSYPYNTGGMFFYGKDGAITFVTQEGELVPAQNPKNIYITSGAAPTMGLDVLADDGGTPYCAVDYPLSTYPYIHAVTAPRAEAPKAMAAAVLDSHIFSGKANALEAYTLNGIAVTAETDGRITFTATYDATVAPYATAYPAYSPFGGSQNRQLKNQTVSLTIFGGIDDLWLTNYEVNLGSATLKKPTSSAYFPKEGEEILYADNNYSLISAKTYLPQSADDRNAGVPIEYNTTIFVYHHDTRATTPLLEASQNTDWRLVQQVGDKLYFQVWTWTAYSEQVLEHLVCFDEPTATVTQLPFGDQLAATPGALYYTDYTNLYRLSLPDNSLSQMTLPEAIPYGVFAGGATDTTVRLFVHHSYDNDISSAHLPFRVFVGDFSAKTIVEDGK